MKDRLLTLLLAVGAFAAFYGYFVPRQDAADESSRPVSTETRANGYLAMRRWLEAQDVPVTELRQRYDWLAQAPGLPASGNLLVTTLPHDRAMRLNEESALAQWIEQGNTLLVLAGVFDTPEWGFPDTTTIDELHRLSGLWIRNHEGEATGSGETAPAGAVSRFFKPLDEPKRGVMKPAGDHALTRGVDAVHAVSEYDAGKFEAITAPDEPVYALMNDEESGLPAFWLTWRGRGRVIVSGYGSIFTNKMLAKAGNAELAANLVAQGLRPGGRVIFDDMHQGAASVYDAAAFFGDARLHATFWWIMGLWFVWVIGSTRLPPPVARPVPARERAFIEATGNFFARVLGRRRTAERLFANFFDDCRRATGDPAVGPPPWDYIRASGAHRADVLRLEALHARVEAGRRVDLVELHNRLQHLRKQLA